MRASANKQARGGLFITGGVLSVMLMLAMTPQWLKLVVYFNSGPVRGLEAPEADYLAGVLWAVLLTAIVAAWGAAVRFQGPLLVVWSAKVIVALTVMLLYDHAYGIDPDGYYLNASTPGFEWTGLQVGEGTINMRQLAWLQFRFLSTSYNASRLTFALIGLIAVYLIYRAAVVITKREDRTLFYVLALTPSVLFWSSILGKDPISLFGVCAYIYGVAVWYVQGRVVGALWITAGLAVSLYLRAWLGPILVVPLLILGAFHAVSITARFAFITLAIVGLAAGPNLIGTATGREFQSSADVLYTANEVSQQFDIGGSSQAVPEIASYGDLAEFAPFGMFTILFRPLPGEVRNLFGTLAGFENLVLLVLAVRASWRVRVPALRNPLVVWAVSVLILWAAVYSVVSFQNLGTASRYKLEITPLLLGVMLYLGSRRHVAQPAVGSAAAARWVPRRPMWNS